MVVQTAVLMAESLAAYWAANWAAQRVLHWDRRKVETKDIARVDETAASTVASSAPHLAIH